MLHVSRLSRNHYQQLGIGFRATQDDIKVAFRELAKKYHPDQNPDNEEADKKFMAIKKSYDFLSDKVKRAEYDRDLIRSGEARRIGARKIEVVDESDDSSNETNHTLSRNQLIGLYAVMIGLPFFASLARRSGSPDTDLGPQNTPVGRIEFWSQSPALPDISPRDELVRAFYNPVTQRWERLDEGVNPPSPYALFQSMVKERRGAYMRQGTSIPVPPKTGVELLVSEVPIRITMEGSTDYSSHRQQ